MKISNAHTLKSSKDNKKEETNLEGHLRHHLGRFAKTS